MSFRKELKYSFTSNEIKLFKSKILKKDFKELFPMRTVNSCYFDTNNLDLFRLSIDGIYPRKKVRLRWYNNNKNICFKEQKISSVEGRFKLSKIYEGFKFQDINKYKFFEISYQILFNNKKTTNFYNYLKDKIGFIKTRIIRLIKIFDLKNKN